MTPPLAGQTIRFADFEVDLAAREVRRHGQKVRMPDQSFRILAALLRRPGEVITRDALRQELWGERFVDFEAGLNTAVKRLRTALNDSVATPRLIETLPRLGYRLLVAVEALAVAPAPAPITSIAVLPLENLTGDPAQDYFAAGMTEALITRLAQVAALRVVSRTSVLRYQTPRHALPDVARELNVDAIVEGTVCRAGERVRINAQLVHGPTDRHLWAQEYERDLADVLLLQAEVATAIVREIRVKLTPAEAARLASARFVQAAAYEAYLRGRFYWDRRTEEGIRKGIQCFQQALEEDPSYPLGYAGVAESYNMLAFWGFAPPHEVSPRARIAATTAIEIDEAVAESHAALGWTEFMYDWNWSAGERRLRRAIELNPNYATAHQWYSHLLVYQGRGAEALAHAERSLALEPLSSVMNSSHALILLLLRRFDDAIAQARRTIDLHPHFPPPYLWLGWALSQRNEHQAAVEAIREGMQLSDNGPHYVTTLASALARAGDTAGARATADQLRARAASQYVQAYDFAVIHAALGEFEDALAELDRACAERSAWLMLITGDSRLDGLRSGGRFSALVSRVGVPA